MAPAALEAGDICAWVIFANAGASLITAKKGTLKVIPEKTEIEVLINEGGFKS